MGRPQYLREQSGGVEEEGGQRPTLFCSQFCCYGTGGYLSERPRGQNQLGLWIPGRNKVVTRRLMTEETPEWETVCSPVHRSRTHTGRVSKSRLIRHGTQKSNAEIWGDQDIEKWRCLGRRKHGESTELG